MKKIEVKEYRILTLDDASYQLLEDFIEDSLDNLFPKDDWGEIWRRMRITLNFWE